MPFKSDKQRRYLWAKHPDIAKRWTDHYGAAIKRRLTKDEKKEKKQG